MIEEKRVTLNVTETNGGIAADGAAPFLRALFSDVVSPERRLSIFTTPDKGARFFSDVSGAVAYALGRMQTQNVYFGLGLIGGRPKGQGKAADVCAIGCLWADIDLAAPWRTGKPLPKTVEEAMTVVDAMPLAPSLIVDSGHGLHVYWFFTKPWVFASEDERTRAACMARRWHQLVCDAAAESGWSLENLGDLARVLRLPGTLNRKGAEPVPVRIRESHLDRRYTLDDFETIAAAGGATPGPASEATLSLPAKSALSDERIIDLASDRRRRKGAGDKFAALWAGQWRELFGSQSEADASLVFRLAYYTKDPVQLDRLFRQSALMREKWDERHGSETYGQRIIRQALETVTAQYHPRKVVSAAEATRYVSASPSLPEVLLPGGIVPITEAGRKLGLLLAATNRYYVRGGVVVALDQDEEKLPILKVVKPAAMTSILEGVAVLTKYVKQGGAFIEVQTTCSEQTAKLLMHAEAFLSELPVIRILTRCAVLIERNGQLVQVSGYDRESGILAAGNPAPDVPMDTAIGMLHELLADFRFATPSDLSRALAALITPALVFGDLLKGRAPVDLGEADLSQAGKGTRNKITGAILGSAVKTITQRKTGGVGGIEETFCSALITGHSIISFDNIRGALDCPSLESFLTEDRFEARIPHLASVEIDPRRVIVQMTSNKAEVTPDLANRSSCVRILKQERGYRFRKYPEGDILDHIRANQPAYLGAVFAVVRAWHAAGKPRTTECDHDFRPWAQTLGWIVEHIFHAAPLLEGHRETQVRIANPNLNWLRDVALAVRRAGCLDQPLRAGYLIDILADAADVETPGLPEGGDVSDETVRKAVLQALGRKLAVCFAGESEVRIDDMVVTRRESVDGLQRCVKDYVFRIDVSPFRYGTEPHSGYIGGSIGENACRKLGQNVAQVATGSIRYGPAMPAPAVPLSKSPNPLCSSNPLEVSVSDKHATELRQCSGDIGNMGTHSGSADNKTVKSNASDGEWTQV